MTAHVVDVVVERVSGRYADVHLHQASCSCGWLGEKQEGFMPAKRDGWSHLDDVSCRWGG